MVFNNEIVVYQKSHEVPYKGIIKGDEQIKYIDTPYGRIGAIVCLDLEFDHFMTQAGSQNIDILVAASSDWTSMQKIIH